MTLLNSSLRGSNPYVEKEEERLQESKLVDIIKEEQFSKHNRTRVCINSQRLIAHKRLAQIQDRQNSHTEKKWAHSSIHIQGAICNLYLLREGKSAFINGVALSTVRTL